ncbi:putative copia-type protein, partial [Trifolium pratense]
EPLQDINPEPIQEITIVPLELCQSVPPDTPSRPLKTRRQRHLPHRIRSQAIEDSPPTPSPSSDPVPQPESHLPPVIRKGEALSHPEWRQAMIDEMCALQSSGTSELVPLPLESLCDTFSPVAKMASIRFFLSIAAIQHWRLHQLDIKNAFLHGDLEEEVYMEQPPGFVAQGESSNMVWCIYLIVYVDDIVITGSDQQGILHLKQYLSNQFQTKDLGKLRYFLGIELLPNQGEPLSDSGRYRRLVGKLNYLTVTRPDNSFAVSVVSQFLNSPYQEHMDAVIRILKYIKGAPGKGLIYEDKGHTQMLIGQVHPLIDDPLL